MGAKPDEIRLVRINPTTRRGNLSTLAGIADRRNELAGSLSLAQELHFVDRVNDWTADDLLPRTRYKRVTVRELALDETRLDGERQADEFPADRDAHRLFGPA